MSELDLDALERKVWSWTAEGGRTEIGIPVEDIMQCIALARRAADAERERDEARADRDRVLTVATSALTERDVVRHGLRELCEKCAPFSAYAGELFARNGLAGSVVLGTHDPDGKYLSITIGDFFNLRAALSRELARAVKEGE